MLILLLLRTCDSLSTNWLTDSYQSIIIKVGLCYFEFSYIDSVKLAT